MAEKINLTLPKQWNACTTNQLELLSQVMIEQIERQDHYHPFSMMNVKIAMFFVFAGIKIVEGVDTRMPLDEQYYTCRFTAKRKWGKIREINGKFPLYLWQINYWLSPKSKSRDKDSPENLTAGAGVLDWMDGNSGIYLTRFPYNTVQRKKGLWSKAVTFQGPCSDLDGFSWAQYRFASDMMQSYTQLSNNLIKMQERGTFSEEQMAQQAESIDTAKAMFLATIFNAKTDYIDTNTGMVKHDYHYETNQCTANTAYFRGFPDVKWQVILFWWTGIMHTLSKRYPHVFKVQKTDPRKRPSTPLEIYTATTATMQKYAGLTEDQVNNQSYSLVLEHLERLSKENEEMERIRKKK